MSTALANPTPKQQYGTIATFLSGDAVKRQIGLALPKSMTADRLVRVSLLAIQKTPKLLRCTPESLASALTQCAEYGLEPNGRDIHLVPFENKRKNIVEVVVIVDYKGLVKLMYRSGVVRNVMAHAVRSKDDFEYRYGTGGMIRHVPADEEDRGPLKGAWAMVELDNGGSPFVFLNNSQVLEHKKASRGADYDDSPWNTHPDSMYAKTALRVLSKFVPMSSETVRAFEEEEPARPIGEMVFDMADADDTAKLPEPKKETKSEQLAKKVKPKAEPKTEPAQTEIPESAYEGTDESSVEGEESQEPLALDHVAEFSAGVKFCKTYQDVVKFRDTFVGGNATKENVTEDEARQIESLAQVEMAERTKAEKPAAPKPAAKKNFD